MLRRKWYAAHRPSDDTFSLATFEADVRLVFTRAEVMEIMTAFAELQINDSQPEPAGDAIPQEDHEN